MDFEDWSIEYLALAHLCWSSFQGQYIDLFPDNRGIDRIKPLEKLINFENRRCFFFENEHDVSSFLMEET